MRHGFIQLAGFAGKAKTLRLTLEDIRRIEIEIMENPERFPVMAGTHGLRKMRFSPESFSSGKSGGIRVCYFVIVAKSLIYLVTAFGKNEQGNLTLPERHAIANVIAAIRKRHEDAP